jgi:molybdopterin molybdotransferase
MKMDSSEIDTGAGYLGYREALHLVCTSVPLLETEELPLDSCVGRIVSEELTAKISYPANAVSLKDGFAVRSEDVAAATPERPVQLRVSGFVFAGSGSEGTVSPGCAVKICSGGSIPPGSDAVVSGEFCTEAMPGSVYIRADAERGRNVLPAGGEIKAGATIATRGEALMPGGLGLAAAAGISRVRVFRRPRAAVIGVGDEVVAPGCRLDQGQLYASNIVTVGAWLTVFGVSHDSTIVKDDAEEIKTAMLKCRPHVDVFLTSGGAWGSERDFVVTVLRELGWQEIFHHVRMGPGKGIAFGLWEGKPVFCLPGGPASNEMAFLQLALPGILRMGGDNRHPLQTVFARLTENVQRRNRAWTEFKEATLFQDPEGNFHAKLFRERSRLQAIARAYGLVCIPEGVDCLKCLEIVPVQLLMPRLDGMGAGNDSLGQERPSPPRQP